MDLVKRWKCKQTYGLIGNSPNKQLHVLYNLIMKCFQMKQGYILLLKNAAWPPGVYRAVSAPLLRVATQDLQTQGDIVDPAARVEAEVAAKQRRIKNI